MSPTRQLRRSPIEAAAEALVLILTASCCRCLPTDADNNRCLTQKMLISCTAKSPALIACGGSAVSPASSAAVSAMATEVLLDWDHSGASSATGSGGSQPMAVLSLELSKPSVELSLVQLDLSGTRLCTGRASSVQLRITFPAYPGPRLAVKGLSLPSVSGLTLDGNIVINSGLLSGLPAMNRLVVLANNVSASSEPLARYAVAGSSALADVRMSRCIHSVAYATPLLDSLEGLHSASITRGNMLLLKAATFQRLPALRYLHLMQNNIQDIETGALAGLHSLEHLVLSFNGLKQLVNYAFSDLASLRRLSLANNRLSLIQPNAFHGLKRLEHLDLSDNQLKLLPEAGFVQLHSLMTLDLQQNRDLQQSDINDTFCPLEGLQTVRIDAPFDCEKFGASKLGQLVQTSVGIKVYRCDTSGMTSQQRPCHSWLARLALQQQLPNGRSSAVDTPPAVASAGVGGVGGADGKQSLNVILLIIFGIVCFVHVLTTAVTIYVCRHMRRRRTAMSSGQKKSPSVSSPEEERSLNASPTGSSNNKDPVLVSFHSGNGSKKAEKDSASDKLNVRDKSYDFNEDENRS